MPIEKIPIVHKFGIISHTQRLELQERLLKQSYQEKYASRKPLYSGKSPLEVTEDFVSQFNGAENLDELEKLEDKARKMLERVKRKAGLTTAGQGSYVDLPVAWTELSQLAQCKGKIQEDCLDILITSLDQACLNKDHIPALFFLAETCLYWLRTDSINEPYLRTSELKLLCMGQLVFIRLFYHHMAGQLQKHDDFKSRLFTYLDGFSDCQEAYNPYPNALLYIRYINEVGKMVIGTNFEEIDPGEIKEGDQVQNVPDPNRKQQIFADSPHQDHVSMVSGAISSSVHDLSPTLWHALDVWRCTKHLSGGLPDALHALASCGTGLASESWVDGMCALHILADAAKVKLGVVQVLQDLARGVPPPSTTTSPRNMSAKTKSTSQHMGSSTFKSASFADSKGLSDIYEKTEPSSALSRDPKFHDLEKTEKYPDTNLQAERTMDGGSKMTGYTSVNTGFVAEAGSESRFSMASSHNTYTNALDISSRGLHGWHWEVGITYTELMADICLHGSTSDIAKVALIGRNKSPDGIERRRQESPMVSSGLIDLVFFTAKGETLDGSANDWSWRIRYSAIQGLVKICQCTINEPTKEGLRTLAWNTLIQVQISESDNRVLEALKVGQVDANIEKLLSAHLKIPPSAIGSKIAAGLSQLYLPQLPPPVDTTHQRKLAPSPQKPKPKRHHSPPKKPLRTGLKEEIALATALYEPPISFEKRTDFDLRRVVEDQWRKQLQQELEEEEEEREKMLSEKQEQVEEKEKEIIMNRKEKTKGKKVDPDSPSKNMIKIQSKPNEGPSP